MTIRESILTAAAAQLTAIAGITTRRAPITALARGEMPAISIVALRDTVDDRKNNISEHTLRILVSVMVRGANPESLADPFCDLAHVALTTNQNLGGALSINLEIVAFESEEADGIAAAVVSSTYAITYRSRQTSLSI